MLERYTQKRTDTFFVTLCLFYFSIWAFIFMYFSYISRSMLVSISSSLLLDVVFRVNRNVLHKTHFWLWAFIFFFYLVSALVLLSLDTCIKYPTHKRRDECWLDEHLTKTVYLFKPTKMGGKLKHVHGSGIDTKDKQLTPEEVKRGEVIFRVSTLLGKDDKYIIEHGHGSMVDTKVKQLTPEEFKRGEVIFRVSTVLPSIYVRIINLLQNMYMKAG